MRAQIFAFTVNGHRRRDHQLFHATLAVQQFLQQHRGALGIGSDVAGDFVHRLPHAYRGRQVEDHVHSLQSAVDRVGVAHIALDELRFRGKICGKLIAVDLSCKAVEDTNVVAGSEQGIRQMRPHKSSAARNQNIFDHLLCRLLNQWLRVETFPIFYSSPSATSLRFLR